ncbi:Purine nucleoside phosphorylase [Candidatus Enterovibrio escicola]|uniref:Purine nucleoside phosphorylase n=1 Tax=Candidatus Enterovibrio escicola TaxID=1927127 RepID=A0A2A5T5S4_9GAMM|nr:Purine nucleoside phosphorylase [Candidatus Enterovibrio escacola]
MATPHINTEIDDFADVVVMSGDPQRAKYISEAFLDEAQLVCDVRGMFGYTGTYKGRKIICDGTWHGYPILLNLDHGADKIFQREENSSCG